MTQADKTIQVAIVLIAFVSVGLLIMEYYPQVAEASKKIARCERTIERQKKILRAAKTSFTQSLCKGSIEGSQGAINRHTKARSSAIAILFLGSLGILAAACIIRSFLIPRRK